MLAVDDRGHILALVTALVDHAQVVHLLSLWTLNLLLDEGNRVTVALFLQDLILDLDLPAAVLMPQIHHLLRLDRRVFEPRRAWKRIYVALGNTELESAC